MVKKTMKGEMKHQGNDRFKPHNLQRFSKLYLS